MLGKKEISKIASRIVAEANALRLKHVPDYEAHVGYCCFFSQSENEFEEINGKVSAFGKVAKVTPTGPVYIIPKLATIAGPLSVFKVRKPDTTRTELGDADFSLKDYSGFKAEFLDKPGFSLISRVEFEMIELVDPEFNVRAYFSNPPVEHQSYVTNVMSKDSF